VNKKLPIIVLAVYSAIYLLVCLNYSGPGYSNEYYVLISVAAFLYGIFIAFSIFNHQNRLSRVRELLRTDDSNLLSVYRQSVVFGKDTQHAIQSKIDDYLISQIDYKITDDYHESTHAFRELSEYVIDLTPKTEKQLAIYQNITSAIANSSTNRKLTGTLVNEKTTTLEWVSILALHLSIAYFIFAFNNGDLLASVASTLVVVTGAVMIVVLYHLNTLTWQESRWIWRPLHYLFIDLGLLPYYPDFVVTKGRADVPVGSEIRVCHYNNPYPDMSGNEIEVLDLDR